MGYSGVYTEYALVHYNVGFLFNIYVVGSTCVEFGRSFAGVLQEFLQEFYNLCRRVLREFFFFFRRTLLQVLRVEMSTEQELLL